ncbi:MAG: hypothetical protein ACRDOH_09590 [Streptosporangiaceae bacterium]
MTKQASIIWERLRRSLSDDPGRFAGGSAVSDPFGLLAVERERLAVSYRSPHDAGPPGVAGPGTRAAARVSTGAASRSRQVNGGSHE